MRIGWAWWSLFFVLLQLLLFPTGTLKASNCALCKYSSFWSWEQHSVEDSGIFYSWLQSREGTGTMKRPKKGLLFLLLLLILVLVANVLQRRQFQKLIKTWPSMIRPSTVSPGSWSPICSLPRSQIHVQTAMKKNYHSCLCCMCRGSEKRVKNAFHTPIAPKAMATKKVELRLKTPW